MSITLKLYNCPSPTNCVNKILNDAEGGNLIRTVSAKVNGTMNRTDPVFTIECDSSTAASIAEVNYLTAGTPLNRNYFVVSIDFTIAKTAVITCHVDLLTTFASRLTTTTLNYVRGSGDITEMDDVSYPISDYMVQQFYDIANWNDIFHDTGDLRQYLLRTVCSPNYRTFPQTTANQGDIFYTGYSKWDSVNQVELYLLFAVSSTGDTGILTPQWSTTYVGFNRIVDKTYIIMSNKIWFYTFSGYAENYTAGLEYVQDYTT